MMTSKNFFFSTFLAGLLICGAARADDDDVAAKPVKLPTEIQTKLGLKSQPLKAQASASTLSGFVKVLDAGPLAQLDSDIETADAAAQASAAEYARSQALNKDGQTVPAKQVEAARLADSAALFQALGGGWWNRADFAEASPQSAPARAPERR